MLNTLSSNQRDYNKEITFGSFFEYFNKDFYKSIRVIIDKKVQLINILSFLINGIYRDHNTVILLIKRTAMKRYAEDIVIDSIRLLCKKIELFQTLIKKISSR